MNAHDVVAAYRQSEGRPALLRELREMDPDDLLALMLKVLAIDAGAGAEVARRVVDGRRFRRLIRFAVGDLDASAMKYPLRVGVDRVGWRRLLQEVGAATQESPVGVRAALYWLPEFRPSSVDEGAEFDRRLEEIHLALGSDGDG